MRTCQMIYSSLIALLLTHLIVSIMIVPIL